MEFLPSFRGEINGGGAKCRLFPQANNQLTSISHSGNHKGNGYKLSAQRFLGVVWVGKHYVGLVNGCLEYHPPIITNARPPKRSQISLRPTLAPILPRVSGVGNFLCQFMYFLYLKKTQSKTIIRIQI